MEPLELILGILIIILSVVISVLVLLQSGENKKLSGAISGGADSFFAKSKEKKKDQFLSKLTLGCSIIFAILVVVMYIFV